MIMFTCRVGCFKRENINFYCKIVEKLQVLQSVSQFLRENVMHLITT